MFSDLEHDDGLLEDVFGSALLKAALETARLLRWSGWERRWLD
jgi:hypothetical protein